MRWISEIRTAPIIQQLSWAIHGNNVHQETYLLPEHWSLHFYEYSGRIDCPDQSVLIQPGACSLVPPNVPITFNYEGPSKHLYCHFSLSKSNSTASSHSNFYTNDARLPHLKSLLDNAIELKRKSPLRANIRLWDVLLGLDEISTQTDRYPKHSRILETATAIASQEMSRNLSIQELAERCQISHNQLIRIIKQHTDMTPVAWLRQLRTDRAQEFLAYTDLPIKVIAAEIGYPDLQHFNKIIRQRFGLSPRQIRSLKNERGFQSD